MYPLMERERVVGGDYKRGPSPPPHFGEKKTAEGRKAGRASDKLKNQAPL